MTCKDCGLPYMEFGIDATLSNEQWFAIHPEGTEGLLCANCIMQRASFLPGIIAARIKLEIIQQSKDQKKGKESMKINAVFEGGGVKGIGLIGAVAITEKLGHQFNQVAGTSAGAIVASLIAAGYSAEEMKAIFLEDLDYRRFKDKKWYEPFSYCLVAKKGLYAGDYFEHWLTDLLEAKGVRAFSDLPEDKLQVIATDITRGDLLVLPGDIERYSNDIEAGQLSVAKVVRMSMSIPFFFRPVILKGNYIVDGGVLSNFPVWLFDDSDSGYLTVGYKLIEPDLGQPHVIRGPVSLFAALFTTMMEAHDARYVEDSDFSRTVAIETLGVRTTDFGITRAQSLELYGEGESAAERFFASGDVLKVGNV